MAINRTIGTDWIANNQLTGEQHAIFLRENEQDGDDEIGIIIKRAKEGIDNSSRWHATNGMLQCERNSTCRKPREGGKSHFRSRQRFNSTGLLIYGLRN